MKDIYEIKIYARAGQGAKTMAQFMAEAAILEGKYAQAFPSYTAARSGAPMFAYVRISDKPILLHCPIEKGNLSVIIEPDLIETDEIKKDMEKAESSLCNCKDKRECGLKIRKIFYLNASKIAQEILGKNFPNIVLLGAFAKITKQIKLSTLKKVVKEKFLKKLGKEMCEKNLKALEKGYQQGFNIKLR